jgi:hypothetical protein
MPAPSEPAPPVDAAPVAVLPAAPDASPESADAPTTPPVAPVVENTGGVAAPPASAAPPAPRPPGLVPPAADLQRQTITIVIQLQPADGDPAGRPVLVSVRAGQGVPLFAAPLRYSALGALPGPVTTLLQHLQLRTLEQRRTTSTAPPRQAASAPASPVPAPATQAAPSANPDSTQLTLF